MVATGKHTVLMIGEAACHCGQPSTRIVRCPKCKTVIARCSLHGEDILRQRAAHC